jgi:drug/metabolite transporter (DMT)-like permease
MRSYWPLILTLAAMWGASYLFIKVAVEDIPPAAMTELRVLLAGCFFSATSSCGWARRRPSPSFGPPGCPARSSA